MKLKHTFYLSLFLLLFTACTKNKISTEDGYDAVELPDGSIVFLSPYSELEYIEAFNQRKVAVSGECYFSVQESDQSFTVEGHLGKVEVLGTEFTIRSEKENMEVEVVEGTVDFKVKGKSEKISAGRMASYYEGSDSIETGKASVNFEKWMAKLRIELKRFDKELNDEAKVLEEKLSKKAKEIEKEADKIGKELDKVGKQIGKSIEKLTD